MKKPDKLLTTLAWYKEKSTHTDVDQYCPTRDVFEARLTKLTQFSQREALVLKQKIVFY